jgi:hypothetical protein
MYKRIRPAPQWLDAPQVVDVYSLSNHVSEDFADYIDYWGHNGYWLFDSPAAIQALAEEHSIPLDGLKLFYFEAHDVQYDGDAGKWVTFEADSSFETKVQPPRSSTLEGFDVVTFSMGNRPECSPLSCNSVAARVSTNAHCLFPTIEAAIRTIEEGRFNNTEPGPYRVIGVYSVCPAVPAVPAGNRHSCDG